MASAKRYTSPLVSQERRVARSISMARLYSPEIIEIGDVVVSLVAEARQIVTDAKLARLLVAVQERGKSFRLIRHMAMLCSVTATCSNLRRRERFARALVVGEASSKRS